MRIVLIIAFCQFYLISNAQIKESVEKETTTTISYNNVFETLPHFNQICEVEIIENDGIHLLCDGDAGLPETLKNIFAEDYEASKTDFSNNGSYYHKPCIIDNNFLIVCRNIFENIVFDFYSSYWKHGSGVAMTSIKITNAFSNKNASFNPKSFAVESIFKYVFGDHELIILIGKYTSKEGIHEYPVFAVDISCGNVGCAVETGNIQTWNELSSCGIKNFEDFKSTAEKNKDKWAELFF